MKRIITILFSVCLCVIANAQIQTKFWGLEFSNNYASLETAKNIISAKCDYAEIVGAEIVALDCNFGGYMWEGAAFSFYRGINGYFLRQVSFFSQPSSYNSAKTKYNALFDSLRAKYGEPKSASNETDATFGLWADTELRFSCMLSLSNSQRKDGISYWGVSLLYTDIEVSNLAKQQHNAEL